MHKALQRLLEVFLLTLFVITKLRYLLLRPGFRVLYLIFVYGLVVKAQIDEFLRKAQIIQFWARLNLLAFLCVFRLGYPRDPKTDDIHNQDLLVFFLEAHNRAHLNQYLRCICRNRPTNLQRLSVYLADREPYLETYRQVAEVKVTLANANTS